MGGKFCWILGIFVWHTNTGHIGLDSFSIIARRALRMSAYRGGVTVTGGESTSPEASSSPEWRSSLIVGLQERSLSRDWRFPIPPDRENRKKSAAMDVFGRRRRRMRNKIWVPHDSLSILKRWRHFGTALETLGQSHEGEGRRREFSSLAATMAQQVLAIFFLISRVTDDCMKVMRGNYVFKIKSVEIKV